MSDHTEAKIRASSDNCDAGPDCIICHDVRPLLRLLDEARAERDALAARLALAAMSDTTTPQEPPSTNNMRYWDEFGRGNDSVCNRDYDTAVSQRNHWKDRAERAERERDEDRRREHGYSQQTVDALTKERDQLRGLLEQTFDLLRHEDDCGILQARRERVPFSVDARKAHHARLTTCTCGCSDLRARVAAVLGEKP